MREGAASGAAREASGPSRDGAGDASLDPAREAARQAARRAFDARARDADMADLVYDSLVDAGPRTTAPEDARRLTFVAGETRVDLEVTDTAVGVHIALLLSPVRAAAVEVRGGETPLVVSVGEDGCAEFDLAAGTLTSLVVPSAAPGGRGLQTAWVRL